MYRGNQEVQSSYTRATTGRVKNILFQKGSFVMEIFSFHFNNRIPDMDR